MKTLKQHIRKLETKDFEKLSEMTYSSRKLYNCALYLINNHFKETTFYLGYTQVYHLMKGTEHYKALNAKMAQQILRLVDKDFRSFFALLQKKNRGEYKEQIKPPRYKTKGSRFNLILPVDQISIIKNKLKITKNLKIPFNYKILGKIKQVIIKPSKINNYFTIYIQYEEIPIVDPELNKLNYLSIDLGLNNLVACISNVGHSFIMNGKPLKAYNQFYNKQKAKIQSELKTKNDKNWSNKLERLTLNRSNYINNYLNQTVAHLIKQCLNLNIGNIVCGYNELWKQEINIGKKNNQNFVNIPHGLFKQKLENKCKEYSIKFIQQEESYTSKCSFLDKESVEKHETYLGKRVKRGLFKTSTNKLVNADVQAAANILRKAVPKAQWVDGIEGCIVSPVKLKHCFNLQR